MDARLDPAKYAGLAEGDAHVIRNAGGRASDDAIRSLMISYKLLGTREWFVVHHTDCGMLLFTNDDMRNLLASSLKTATLDQSGWRDSGEGPGSAEGNYVNWLTFSNNAKSVVEDVKRIRNHPLVPGDIPIPDYALSSAIKAWYKTGTYGCFCGFERWRATRCSFKRGSARPSLLFFTEQRISAGRR
jgi:carbonic anhydrase